MGKETGIQWADATFNPWRGCTKVSPACDMCYAETMSKRNPAVLGVWGKYGSRVIASESMWKQPVKWNRDAEAAGVRKRVFCASLADVFEGPESMPAESWEAVSQARERLGRLIDETPGLDWLLLTKRPENVLKYGPLGHRWTMEGIPQNVWIGTTVENQKYADIRIPELLKVPAKVRFLSMEPLLEEVIFDAFTLYDDEKGEQLINWVIVGGESGGEKARPMNPSWVRKIQEQCAAVGIPFFFKQWGEWVDEFHGVATPGKQPTSDAFVKLVDGGSDYLGVYMCRVGKQKAGRELDGQTWSELPK